MLINIAMAVEVLVIDVRADAVIDTLSGGVEIMAAAVVVIACEFVVTVYCFVDDGLFNMAVEALIDGGIMRFVSGIGVEVLPGVNANVAASERTALEFAVPNPLRKFGF